MQIPKLYAPKIPRGKLMFKDFIKTKHNSDIKPIEMAPIANEALKLLTASPHISLKTSGFIIITSPTPISSIAVKINNIFKKIVFIKTLVFIYNHYKIYRVFIVILFTKITKNNQTH